VAGAAGSAVVVVGSTAVEGVSPTVVVSFAQAPSSAIAATTQRSRDAGLMDTTNGTSGHRTAAGPRPC